MSDGGFVAVLLGAIVGGAASLAGSVYVSRREIVRSSRVRLHDELLPELAASIDREPRMSALLGGYRGGAPQTSAPPLFEEVLAATRRSAALAGATALDLVREIEAANRAYRDVRRRQPEPELDEEYGTYRTGMEQEVAASRARITERIDDLSHWVEGKILGGPTAFVRRALSR